MPQGWTVVNEPKASEPTGWTRVEEPKHASLSQPSMVDSVLADNPAMPLPMRAMQGVLRMVKAHPVAAGSMAGAALGSAATGGALAPVLAPWALGMAGAGLGAAGGAGAAIAGRQIASGAPESGKETAKTMATEGALAAGGEGAGRLIGQGLKLAGRGAYRVALSPDNAVLKKYGDVVGEGLETATPVSKEGLAKATQSKVTRIAAKKAALNEADQRVGFSAKQIADEASSPLATYSTKQVRAGLPDPTPEFTDRLAQFQAANPNGTLKPSSLDEVKSTIDDTLGGAYRKQRMREPITGSEKAGMEMSHAMSRANESAVPGYRQMNRDIMDAEGLRKAVESRTLGSKGNQVLDTLLMLMRGPAGVPGRVAMMPPLLSRAGIGAYKGAAAAPLTLRSALIAALSPDTPENQK